MELIQDWKKEDKDKLLTSIKEKLKIEYTDIIIFGSRIFGDFIPISDIDVVIYSKHYKDQERFIFYTDNIPNEDSRYNNFQCSVEFKEDTDYLNSTWQSIGNDYFLSRYSIVSDTFYEGNRNHEKHHIGARKLLVEYKGLNVPFDDYNEKNKHLIIKQ